ELLLGVCAKRSFERISVDGQLSTNDAAILMCSGASGVAIAPESEDELRFGEALDALLRALAIMMVADGQGARRIARVIVRGGNERNAEAAARAVANSPVVKTVVIKYGGAAMVERELCEEFARDVVLLKYVGLNPIVVHGGGPDITRYMERLALPVEFVDGLRVSDEGTVEVAKMVLVGKVNKDIVLRLQRHGQPAVGLSGDDGSLFRVARRSAPGGEDI